MGTRELIASLRAGAEAKARALEENASREAESAVRDTERKIAGLRESKRREAEGRARAQAAALIAAARSEARRMEFEAARELAGRLYSVSTSTLPSLRKENYERVFRLLAGELPRREWASIRVNPLDVKLAGEALKGADIVGDETVSGGLDAATKGGMIRVDNTFEKRLERAWDELLPKMMAELAKGEGE